MNTPSRTRVNGDASAGLALASGTATTDASQATNALLQGHGGGKAEVKNVTAEPQATKAPERPEPALSPADENPAIPRDKHHGKGGMYALVNGKRVKADDEGNPLPDDQQGD